MVYYSCWCWVVLWCVVCLRVPDRAVVVGSLLVPSPPLPPPPLLWCCCLLRLFLSFCLFVCCCFGWVWRLKLSWHVTFKVGTMSVGCCVCLSSVLRLFVEMRVQVSSSSSLSLSTDVFGCRRRAGWPVYRLVHSHCTQQNTQAVFGCPQR